MIAKRTVGGRCRQPLRSYESISVTNVGLRCYPCFNEETAALMGVDFDHTQLEPITVADAASVEHTFEFRSMLVPTGHALHARERLPEGREGYESSVLDFEADVWDLFNVLYDRIRHALAIRYVERGELGWRITDAHRLTGRITWDPDRSGEVPLLAVLARRECVRIGHDSRKHGQAAHSAAREGAERGDGAPRANERGVGRSPTLMIDGQPFSWDQVGRMLMSFEGFTLRAVVDDTIEVVGGPLLDEHEKLKWDRD